MSILPRPCEQRRAPWDREGGGGEVLTLAQVAEATSGQLVGSASCVVTSVSTDSRTVPAGALFVALAGPSFDGHSFLAAARESGAAACLVSDERALAAGKGASLPAVVVGDTLQALQDLAAWHRRRLAPVVVALTGSAGKTTTKELLGAVLGLAGPTLVTQGNLNNHIGVPLTLLRLQPEHRFAVIEMGCSGWGEIALLARLASPSLGLITNVGEAHLEGLGTLEGVARAKGELFAALPPDGTVLVNLDDPRVVSLPSPAQRRVGFGRAPEAAVRLAGRRPSGDGRQEVELVLGGQSLTVTLGLLGAHNASNALAAAAAAHALGVPPEVLQAGLARVTAAPGRLQVRAGVEQSWLIDDTYNANPGSMWAALAVLQEQAAAGARTHALLGEMLELGPSTESLHEDLGRVAAEAGVSSLIAVGRAASWYHRGARSRLSEHQMVAVSTPEEGAQAAAGRLRAGDWLLIKASRGIHLERAVAPLLRGAAEAREEA